MYRYVYTYIHIYIYIYTYIYAPVHLVVVAFDNLLTPDFDTGRCLVCGEGPSGAAAVQP